MSVFTVTVACRVKSLNRCWIEKSLLKGMEKEGMIVKKLIKNINVLFFSNYKCKCYYLKFRTIVKHSFTVEGLYHLLRNVSVHIKFIVKTLGTTVAPQTKYT